MSRRNAPGTSTRLAHLGRNSKTDGRAINPPVERASTLLFASLDELEGREKRRLEKGYTTYGRSGTSTTLAFEETLTGLEGGYGTLVASSGLGAVAATLFSLVGAGDHLLVSDSVYGPGRTFCQELAKRFVVEVEYFDPLIGAGIAKLLRPDSRLVYCESPGSLTFEVQDIPAIAAAARENGTLVLLDNTWATPLFFQGFRHGVDIVLHAATKYVVGHSDVMLGAVVASEAVYPALRRGFGLLGQHVSPDDVYLALRGLRTLAVRLPRHQENGLRLARWFQDRPEVARMLHPALPGDPGHALWKRDFCGASGLFSVVLKPCTRAAVAAFVEGLELFGMGASWGGFESLVLPADPAKMRSATRWQAAGPLLRFHAGLEDPADLIADLEAAFARFAAAEQKEGMPA
ncbi:MAG: cystathionine beta-lyase [Kiloniellales bacterium]